MRFGLASLAVAAAFAPALSPAADFDTYRCHEAGGDLGGVAAGDVDGDGHIDLVCTIPFTKHLAVLLADGSGGFLPPRQFRRAGPRFRMRFVALADFDGDGALDVVQHGGLWHGDGAGGFAPAVTPELVTDRWVTISDLNGDGFLDLAGAGKPASTVGVLLNDGARGFETQVDYPAGVDMFGIASGDVTGDAIPDLVATDIVSGTVVRLTGDGLGGFAAPVIVASVPAGSHVALFDADGDGALDLAVASSTQSSILHFLGDGNGAFSGPDVLAVGNHPVETVVADLDGDGTLDLLAVNSASNDVAVLAGDGTGSFAPARKYRTPSEPQGAAVADIDGDGRVDIAVASEGSSSVAVLHGVDAGAFESASAYSAGPNDLFAATLGDFDEDGHEDVAAVQSEAGAVSLMRGTGTGVFAAPILFPAGVSPTDIVAGDFDEDGHLDVVVSESGIFLLPGDGDGGFSPPIPTTAVLPLRAEAVADLDDDGHLDVVSRRLESSRLILYFGNGDCGFDRVVLQLADNVVDVAIGRIDPGPTLDLVVVSNYRVLILAGDGARGFAAAVAVPDVPAPQSVTVGFVDADAVADIVTTNFGEQNVSVLIGDGSGAFRAPVNLRTWHTATDAAIADVDEDGNGDIVVSGIYESYVSFFRGDGEGAFESDIRFGTSRDGWRLLVADANEDGHDDFLVASGVDRALFVHLNRTFGPEEVDCRAGNVNAGVGPTRDVLFVNGSRGFGPRRELIVDRADPFEIRMESPDAIGEGGPPRFMLHVWAGPPRASSVTPTAFGTMCAVPEFSGGFPKRTWNNTGEPLFGAPDFPSEPAPSLVFRRERGVGRRGTFFFQGVIDDSGSPSGIYAVTNGILFTSR